MRIFAGKDRLFVRDRDGDVWTRFIKDRGYSWFLEKNPKLRANSVALSQITGNTSQYIKGFIDGARAGKKESTTNS